MIEIPLLLIITKLLTIGVRLSGLMLFAPFFGSVVIPARGWAFDRSAHHDELAVDGDCGVSGRSRDGHCNQYCF